MKEIRPLRNAQISSIGEEIGYELGSEMVKDYQTANPDDTHYYVIGRNIIDQILNQPGCVAIKYFSAYNEIGEKTMVYLGLDADGKAILKHSYVNQLGELSTKEGIVADRTERGGGRAASDSDNWNWEID